MKKNFMYCVKWTGAVGGSLIILASIIGGLISFSNSYHARFASAIEFKQLGKDYAEFATTTRVGDKKAERREIERDILRIKRDAHGRRVNRDEADSIRVKEAQLKEINEDIQDLKELRKNK